MERRERQRARAEGADRGRTGGRPFLVFRDGAGEQRIVPIEADAELWVGRGGSADVRLEWDEEVSALHAQIEVVRDECTLVDDGLSRNGSFVNEERVHGRRHLRDGDTLRFGRTTVVYRRPGEDAPEATAIAGEVPAAATVSPAQRSVLLALCRPYKDGDAVRDPGDQPADRRRAAPQRRRGQDPHAGALREARGRRPAAEPEARGPGRARPAERHRQPPRAVRGGRGSPLGSLGAGAIPGESGSTTSSRPTQTQEEPEMKKLVLAAIAVLAVTIVPATSMAAPVKFGSKLNPTVQPSNSLPGLGCGELAGPCTFVQQEAYGRPDGGELAPKTGTIKKIRLIAGGPGSFKLQIAKVKRSTLFGTNEAKIVANGPRINYLGQSELNFEDDSYRVETFDVNVPVKKGQQLALKGNITSMAR